MELLRALLNSLSTFALVRIVPALILLVLGLLAIRIALQLVGRLLNRTKLEKAAHTLILSVVRIALYILLFLIIASYLGIDVTSIVALASVLTLAISLAVQNALANVFGGFTLLCTHPFATGDFVEIAGQSGTVREIGLTYTKMATGDNKLVSVPNSAVTAAQIINYTALGCRRVEVEVSAAYTAPVEQVLEALVQAADVPGVHTDPAPNAVVVAYGDSAIRYKLFLWCDSADYWSCHFAATQKVQEVFRQTGIEMTYPHLNVHIDK